MPDFLHELVCGLLGIATSELARWQHRRYGARKVERQVPEDALYCAKCKQWMTGLQLIGHAYGEVARCPKCSGPVRPKKGV